LSARIVQISDDRPWVGGVDSTHSILYFSKYGRQLVSEATAPENIAPPIEYACPFRDLAGFKTVKDLEIQYYNFKADGRSFGYNDYIEWCKTMAPPPAGSPPAGPPSVVLQIFPGGILEKPSLEYECEVSSAYMTVKSILLKQHSYL